MAYTKTTWVNGQEPSLNEDNLNKIEQGIYDNSVAVDNLNTNVANVYTKPQVMETTVPAKYGLSSAAMPTTVLDKLSGAGFLKNVGGEAKYTAVTINLANVAEGDTIKIPEEGGVKDYLVAKLNYESGLNGTGRVLLARKDSLTNTISDNWDGETAKYDGSHVDVFLNSVYFNSISTAISDNIPTTSFYYTPEGVSTEAVTTLSKKVFLGSATEWGVTLVYEAAFHVEGSICSALDSYRKVLYENNKTGTSVGYAWTRTPDTSYDYKHQPTNVITTSTDVVQSGKTYNGATVQSERTHSYDPVPMIIPMFTLPSTFSYTLYQDTSGGWHTEQEYTGAYQQIIDALGNVANLPYAKIQTGSYVGTGTYGESNPCSLTFDKSPEYYLMIIDASNGVSSAIVPVGFPGTMLANNVNTSRGYIDSALTVWSNDNKTATWVSNIHERYQYNQKDHTYVWYTV